MLEKLSSKKQSKKLFNMNTLALCQFVGWSTKLKLQQFVNIITLTTYSVLKHKLADKSVC